MQNEEQQLIEGLFNRLKQAELQNSQRDTAVEQMINQFMRAQPAASYYMAQAILIQEAAIKKLHDKITMLEKAPVPPAKSGFLSSLFGGSTASSSPSISPSNAPSVGWTPQPTSSAPTVTPAAGRSSGFLSGALQTAAGVAGGMVVADMLKGMFHHSQPEEIVNIIQEPATEIMPDSTDLFNYGGTAFPQRTSWDQSYSTDNDTAGSFMADDSFSDDNEDYC